MGKTEIKYGAVLSYVLILMGVVYGLVLTPFILKYVGDGNYGVYRSIASISNSLAVMDFGLGSTLTRYMAHYHATNEKDKACNFVAMVFVQFACLAALIAVIGFISYFFIDPIYGNSFSSEELLLAKKLFFLLIINVILRLLENLYFGIASGYEHFISANGVKLISMVLKITLILVLLPVFKSIMVVAIIELAVVVLAICCLAIYDRNKIGIVPRLAFWDNKVFRESLGYTSLMFVQTLTTMFNGNVDNVLIGAIISATSVTVYSMAIHVFSMYESLSGSIANIMLPNMAKRVNQNQTAEQLQAGVVKAGRFQFFLLAAALGGFLVLGQDFFALWLGEGFSDCYVLTLILIIPITLAMVQNVSLSILRAQNKMGYRTLTLGISCIISIIVSVIGIKFVGYWGAAIGTSCATIANLIFMNIYYKKVLHFQIVKMFYSIFHRTALCAAVASVTTFFLNKFLNGNWMMFIVNVIAFLAVYVSMLLLWGADREEKTLLFGIILRQRRQ